MYFEHQKWTYSFMHAFIQPRYVSVYYVPGAGGTVMCKSSFRPVALYILMGDTVIHVR